MNEIPKIIHQVWSGVNEPLPDYFKSLSETWKRDYPDWRYEFWDNNRMNDFVKSHYPEYWDVYMKYPYNIQRWDSIRYLILDKIGGMYVDFDYESIKPIHTLIKGKKCCFALEPQSHCFSLRKRFIFNNALMLNSPGSFFMKKVIERTFSKEILQYDTSCRILREYNASNKKIREYKVSPKNDCVINTTGPLMLVNLYNTLSAYEKDEICLLPAKYVSPLDEFQSQLLRSGESFVELEESLKNAYAIHYFFSDWREDLIRE